MDPLNRQVLYNIVRLLSPQRDGQTITHGKLIEELGKPVPSKRQLSDAVILQAYRHYVTNAGVNSADRVVSYEEASQLTGKSVEAIRQAAYRKSVIRLTEYRDGRVRAGVVFRSLKDWCKWTPEEFDRAARLLDSIRAEADQ